MAISISNAAAIALCAAYTAQIDLGAGQSNLLIYGGAAPANADVAIGAQPVLVEFDLPDPAFGAPVDLNPGAIATANAVPSTVALATGTATFFRILNGDGLVVMQGTVTDTAGNGDCKLSSTSIIAGIDVTVVSITVTMLEA